MGSRLRQGYNRKWHSILSWIQPRSIVNHFWEPDCWETYHTCDMVVPCDGLISITYQIWDHNRIFKTCCVSLHRTPRISHHRVIELGYHRLHGTLTASHEEQNMLSNWDGLWYFDWLIWVVHIHVTVFEPVRRFTHCQIQIYAIRDFKFGH